MDDLSFSFFVFLTAFDGTACSLWRRMLECVLFLRTSAWHGHDGASLTFDR